MDVLIIGTGNIGKRHLQGASFLPVSCYDISRDSLESVRPFCESNKIRIPKLLPELDDALNTITPETVVIVATTANGRVPLFKKIVSRNPREVILEKPACQSLSEYKQLMKITGEGEVYVNIPRTLYPVYQQIGLEGKHAMFFANSSNAGMVCNGISVQDD